jgi:epoxyqueuosine reductase
MATSACSTESGTCRPLPGWLHAMAGADPELTERVKALALELGFARAGVARADALGHEAERLREWLAAGHHASMEYMLRTADVRVDPRDARMLASARSVLVLAAPYARAEHAADGPAPGRVARYAQGRDYHNALQARLRKITRLLREAGHATRAAVDTMPVLERAWAQRAGIGFIGKNSCVIVPGLGSHVFLAAIVTSAELTADEPMRERCGECRLCLDACPTRAFVAPRWLDARRCIAYLTIEHRGPIARELRAGIGDWLFGCDACQDVCPWNRGASNVALGAGDVARADRWQDVSAEALLAMDDAQFMQFAQATPLRRPGREGVARNAAIVLGNARVKRALPVLRDAAQHDASAVVREAASWAIERIERDER